MAIQQPPLIPQPWGSDGTVGTIPQTTSESGRASWATGFPTETALPLTEGGIPPSYLDFQGVLNALSAHTVFAQTGSTYAWSALENYAVGSRILGSDGAIYVSVAESGPQTSAGAVNPTGNVPTYWAIVPNMQEINTNIQQAVAGEATARQQAINELETEIDQKLDALEPYPEQSGNQGASLVTNGTSVSWWPVAENILDAAEAAAQGSETEAGELTLASLDAAKADVGLGNLSSSGRSLAAGLGMPSTRYVNLTPGVSGTMYTAPANGYFALTATSSGTSAWYLRIRNGHPYYGSCGYTTANVIVDLLLPVRAGDEVQLLYGDANPTWNVFYFIYAEGEES